MMVSPLFPIFPFEAITTSAPAFFAEIAAITAAPPPPMQSTSHATVSVCVPLISIPPVSD